MTVDYAALEARVAELERQMRHVLPAKIDATAYAVSLVHEETRAIRDTQDKHGTMLQDHGTMLSDHGTMLSDHGAMLRDHGAMLQEILRRLPPEPPGEFR